MRRTLVCPSVPLWLPSVTSRHLANYDDTCTFRRGPHIVRPSRPHKFLSWCKLMACGPFMYTNIFTQRFEQFLSFEQFYQT